MLGRKVVTTIRIDEDILKKAHDLGLNISKISQNAVEQAVEKMEA